MSILSFENVSYIRDKKQILSEVSWTVEPGENWAVMGLNASGKSSLIKLIMAEQWKTSGNLTVLGCEFGRDEIPALRQKIAIVGSFIAERFSHGIRAENLVYTGKFNSSMLYKPFTDEELDEARELMRQVGAEKLIGRTYANLSQGEKQLLLIARSLMIKPDILILDEATNGLDLFAKERLLDRLHEITSMQNAPTLLYITHHPDEITADFDKVLLLRRGQVIQAGKRDAILTDTVLSDFYESPVSIQNFQGKRFVIPRN